MFYMRRLMDQTISFDCWLCAYGVNETEKCRKLISLEYNPIRALHFKIQGKGYKKGLRNLAEVMGAVLVHGNIMVGTEATLGLVGKHHAEIMKLYQKMVHYGYPHWFAFDLSLTWSHSDISIYNHEFMQSARAARINMPVVQQYAKRMKAMGHKEALARYGGRLYGVAKGRL